ncbi:polysulfide reductase NrfD, partial [bacterium BMS3Abin03]|nr:polysulfide reductase NrfD [bacterium BMS3Abin03]
MINKAKTLKDILCFFIFFGLVAGIFRLWFGLGATTNLTDSVPWGLWKVLNMIAGVALSTCGFTIGFLVYVLKIEKFKPLVKPAILVAFLGYGSSCFALLFDIGQPYRFWHPLFMWNEHSFLFEVFWCVMLYFSVTFIELMPNILEKYKLKKTVGFLHKITIGIVIIGISLSTLHHSSLGSLFLITPYRLSELWYSSLLPV